MHSILDLTKQDVYSSIAIAVAIDPGPAHRPRGGVLQTKCSWSGTHYTPCPRLACVTVLTLIPLEVYTAVSA